MNSPECYFDECEKCEFQDHSDDTMICLVNRLGLAFHKLLMDIPLLNEFIDKYRFCNWFIQKK